MCFVTFGVFLSGVAYLDTPALLHLPLNNTTHTLSQITLATAAPLRSCQCPNSVRELFFISSETTSQPDRASLRCKALTGEPSGKMKLEDTRTRIEEAHLCVQFTC